MHTETPCQVLAGCPYFYALHHRLDDDCEDDEEGETISCRDEESRPCIVSWTCTPHPLSSNGRHNETKPDPERIRKGADTINRAYDVVEEDVCSEE